MNLTFTLLLTAALAMAETPTSFTVTTVNVAGAPDSIRIDVFRWSTDAERDQLLTAWNLTAPPATAGRGGGGSGHGSAGAGVQMLTDTEGVNFDDYLRRVYITVKQNWFAVMPASVQLGDQGVVSLQFKIMRDGSVPDGDPQRVFGSGKEPLDRAAISSIRASNPFPTLPPQFKGPYIELRFTYYYNLPIPSN